MLVVVDPGHGGKDPGACGNDLKEKDITLKLGKLVTAELKKYQVDVLMTREDDTDVSLIGRVGMANKEMADFFLSLHVNAGGGTGFESYRDLSAGPKTRKYQEIIHEKIASLKDRGKKAAANPRLYVLRYTHMPALLLECLFIDNEIDAVFLRDDSFLKRLAEAIAEGVVQALGLKPRIEPKQVWDPQVEINKLRERGLIAESKGSYSSVSWGELATVLNRILDRSDISNGG